MILICELYGNAYLVNMYGNPGTYFVLAPESCLTATLDLAQAGLLLNLHLSSQLGNIVCRNYRLSYFTEQLVFTRGRDHYSRNVPLSYHIAAKVTML